MAARVPGSDPGDTRALLWFRKGLRLHDNAALLAACDGACHVYPVFVLDPWFLRPDPAAPSPGSTRVGINRIRFLLECLEDLDQGLRERGSRLILTRGDPTRVIPEMCQAWGVNRLCFEFDTEPYAQARDEAVREACRDADVAVVSPVGHTMYDPREILKKNGGKPPLTYQSFCKIKGTPPPPLGDAPEKMLPPGPEVSLLSSTAPGPGSSPSSTAAEFSILPGVPSLADLGYSEAEAAGEGRGGEEGEVPPFKGGEREGLRRLEEMMKRTAWVAEFEKPKTDPSAFLTPGTTVLSPYLKFGCVSARLMYKKLNEVYGKVKKHSQPPVSLEGQLLWREFFYAAAYGTPNFDRMEGSPICRQIPFEYDQELLAKWRDAKTGFPWIDACMTQLRDWGWMHHLARHCVACFLTRGDLFVHWELGRDVFDRLLLDADWSINNGNWLWLSASAFFSQYHRVYSPVTFGKKYDPHGKFIRHFLPVLKDMPAQYIYEPWTAPLAVQKKAKCIIGQDYPHPVVDHADASKVCKSRMAEAYGTKPKLKGLMGDDEEEDSKTEANPKKRGSPASGKAGKAGKGSKRQVTLEEFTKKEK